VLGLHRFDCCLPHRWLKGGVIGDRHRIAHLLEHKQPLLVGIAVYPRIDFNPGYRLEDLVIRIVGKRLPKPLLEAMAVPSLR
jgi:hypothetical protein